LLTASIGGWLVWKYYQSYLVTQADTSSWTFDSGANYTFDAAHIKLEDSSAQLAVPWWDANYSDRQVLKVKNTSSESLAANTTLQIHADTSSLASVQADCDDVRIVYYNGSTNTELDRYYQIDPGASSCTDSTSTLIAFPLQATLAAGSSSDAYYLYYGYDSASAPANPEDGYDIGAANSLLTVSFREDTTGSAGETPSAASGALRYAGSKAGLVFDGVNDYGQVGDSTSLSVTKSVTVEAWVKTYATGTEQTILGKWDETSGTEDRSYRIWITSGNRFAFSVSSGGTAGTISTITGTTTTVASNTWYHVAGVYDSYNQTLDLYVNGASDATQTSGAPASVDDNGSSLYLGGKENSSGSVDTYFQGILDEIRISTGVRYPTAFTAPSRPLTADSFTCLLLHADEGGDDPRQTEKLPDASGNGNHLTISGAKYVTGLVGVDAASTDAGAVYAQTYAGHPGVYIETGTTNKVTNPSFEHATYNTSWTTSGGTASENSTWPPYRFGSKSYKLALADSTNQNVYTAIDAGNTNTHTLSAYVYRGTSGYVGASVDNSVVQLYFNGSAQSSTSYTDAGGGWWRLSYTAAAGSGSQTYGVAVLEDSGTVYIDGVQLEEKSYATSYTDGTLGTGYAWTGTAHASSSTRTKADLMYAASTANLSASAGTVSFWMKTSWTGNDSILHELFAIDTTSGSLRLYKDSDNSLKLTDGTNTASKAVSWAAGQWQFLTASWGSNTMQVTVNSAAGTASGAYSAPTINTSGSINIGSDTAESNHADGIVSDFRIYDSALSAAEIADLYASGLLVRSIYIPYLQNDTVKPAYTTLSAFTETTGSGHAGTITYQLSFDGSSWFYFVTDTWLPIGSTDHANTASVVQTNINTFPADVGTGSLVFRAYLDGSSPKLDTLAITYTTAPTAPGSLYADNTSAQTGQTDPQHLTDTTPAFSAVYTDPNPSDIANKVRIQVSTDNTFSSVTHWDSGATGTSISDITESNRSSDIVYNSFGDSAIQSLNTGDGNTTYYWRIKFWDDDNNEGAWSTAASFGMQDAPAAPGTPVIDNILANSLDISWTDNSSGQTQEESFELHHSTDGVEYSLLQTNDPDDVDHTHGTLNPNTRHYYKVRSINTTGTSSFSSAADVYTAANVPGAPVLSNANYGDIHFILDENSNPSNVSYAIAVSTDNFVSDTKYIQSDITLGDVLGEEDWQTYTDWGGINGEALTGLSNAQEYSFKVKARNSDSQETAYSTTAQLTTWTQPDLSLDVSGTDLGSIDISGNNDSIPFGFALPGVPVTAVQKISITTNADSGYTVSMVADAKMTHTETPVIDVDFITNGFEGTNTAPVAWSSPAGTVIGENTAFIGYHTSDSLLGTGTTNRFAAADSWAGFATLGSYYEILYLSGPTSGDDNGEEYAHITFKLETNNLHPTGNYSDLVVKYRVVPVF